jgi:hypothetical protein
MGTRNLTDVLTDPAEDKPTILGVMQEYGVPEWSSAQSYDYNVIASMPGVGLVACSNASGSAGDNPAVDDGTNWLNVGNTVVVADTSTTYGIPLRTGTLIVVLDPLINKVYRADTVLPATNSVSDGDVTDLTDIDIYNILNTANKWYRPQRTTVVAQAFSTNMSLDFNVTNDIGVALGSGAYNIANPYVDEAIVGIHKLDPLLGEGHILPTTEYRVTIEDVDFTYTTGSSPTAAEIMAGLEAEINDGVTGSAYVTAEALDDDTLKLTSSSSGTSWSLTTDGHLFYSMQGQSGMMIFDSALSDTDPVVTGDWFDFGTQGAPTDVAGDTYAIIYYVRKFDTKGIWARWIVSETA